MSENNESVHGVSVTLALEDFLASADVKRVGNCTREEYTVNLTIFCDWCNSYAMVQGPRRKWQAVLRTEAEQQAIYLHQINAIVVECFLDHIKATRRPSKIGHTQLSSHTIVQYVKDIKRFLNWCVQDKSYQEHVSATAVQRIKKPKLEQKIIDIFTVEEIHALFAACQKECHEDLRIRDRAIVALLLDTGIRAMELCTLMIGYTNRSIKNSHIRVQGKGNKWGEIGIGRKCRQYVQEYIEQVRIPFMKKEMSLQHSGLTEDKLKQMVRQQMPYEYLFVNRASKPITTNGLYQIIARLGEWAGIDTVRCSPHTWRHTFASLFMRQGGNIYILSKLLRHSSVKVTEEYLKSLKQSEARLRAKSVLDSLQE